jgi:hypothetical protein
LVEAEHGNPGSRGVPLDSAGGGVTYGEAYAAVASSGSRAKARDFTKAVLGLRHDPRVQGEALV